MPTFCDGEGRKTLNINNELNVTWYPTQKYACVTLMPNKKPNFYYTWIMKITLNINLNYFSF